MYLAYLNTIPCNGPDCVTSCDNYNGGEESDHGGW